MGYNGESSSKKNNDKRTTRNKDEGNTVLANNTIRHRHDKDKRIPVLDLEDQFYGLFPSSWKMNSYYYRLMLSCFLSKDASY